MGALRPFVTGIVLTILFGFFIFAFMTNFLGQNNPDAEILKDSNVNKTIASFDNSLKGFKNISDDAHNLLQADQPSPTSFLFLIFKSAFSIPVNFLSMVVFGTKGILDLVFVNLFGGTDSNIAVLSTIVASILVVAGVLYIIKTVRTGESER